MHVLFWNTLKFAFGMEIATIKTPVGGAGHGFERLIRGVYGLDRGFRVKQGCARISPIMIGDNFQCEVARDFATLFFSITHDFSLSPTLTVIDCLSHYHSIVVCIGITRC